MALHRNVEVCNELHAAFPDMRWYVGLDALDCTRTVYGQWGDLSVRLSWTSVSPVHYSASVRSTLADEHHPKRITQLGSCEGSPNDAVTTVRQALVAAVGCLRDNALKCNTLLGVE